MGFSRQEYWSGLPFPSLGDLPRDWIQVFHTAGRFFTIWATREALLDPRALLCGPTYEAASGFFLGCLSCRELSCLWGAIKRSQSGLAEPQFSASELFYPMGKRHIERFIIGHPKQRRKPIYEGTHSALIFSNEGTSLIRVQSPTRGPAHRQQTHQ